MLYHSVLYLNVSKYQIGNESGQTIDCARI